MGAILAGNSPREPGSDPRCPAARRRPALEVCYDPDDWSPAEGRADLLRLTGGRVAEVSLTPSPPLFAGTRVERRR
jgi:hypothetical protein